MTNDSLHVLIRRAIEDSGLVDPRAVAAKVAVMIPPERVDQILVDALVGEVRHVMSAQRNRALSNALGSEPSARSAKVAGVRSWWAEMCAASIHVGDGAWKSLGDCGHKDLAYAEAERRVDAARELHRADMYAQLRGLLRKHKVRTVSQLPPTAAQGLAA